MHVAHFEAGALTRQAARPEGRETPLVRELGERVRLVHELRQLGRPEERLDHRRHRAGVDQVVERDLLGIGVDAHPLLDQPRHARQADRELVRDQLTHRADAAVAQVVDVVRVPAAVRQVDQVADDRDEVVLGEDGVVRVGLEPEPLVDLVPAHAPEVVALRVEEQALDLLPRRLQVRRVAGPEQGVDLLEGLGLAVGRVLLQRVLDQRRLAARTGEQHVDLVDAGLEDLRLERLGQVGTGLGQHLAVGIGHRERQHRVGPLAGRRRVLVVAEVDRGVAGEDAHLLDAHVPHGVDALGGELIAHRAQRGALRLLGVRHFLGEQRAQHLALLLPGFRLGGERQLLGREEQAEDVRVLAVPERAQQRGGRELLLLVDVDVDHVVNVDRELHPRAAERDDARREQPLAVRVRILLEDDARGAVQLAHHDALGAVDDERPERGHDRELPEVDLLLDDVLRPLLALDFLVDDQLERRLEGRGVRHVTLDALLDRVLRLADDVAEEVEVVLPVYVADGEQVAEHAFQRHVLPVAVGVLILEERLESGRLDVEQVRHVHAAVALAERDHGLLGLRHRARSGTTQWAPAPNPRRGRGVLGHSRFRY